jgi:hypothetical protein
MWLIISTDPDTVKKLLDLEYFVGKTFFKPDYVPKKYRRGYDPKSKKQLTRVIDVIEYLKEKHATGDLFKNDKQLNGCKSVYMICE